MSDAHWRVKLGLLVSAITMLLMVSCGGGGGGTVNLAPPESGGSGVAADVTRSTGILIHEDEIGSLPAWQQELLSDPGWNQPYIEPRARTEMEAPTPELLMETYRELLERGEEIHPRGLGEGKGTSWVWQDDYDGITQVVQGEFENVTGNGTPTWGCNNEANPDANGHELDDVIRAGTKHEPQAICYVLRDHSVTNWFNTTGGSGNDAGSAVYQLFSSDRGAIAEDWEWYDENQVNPPRFEELTYRADLAPGVGVGGDCSAATAYLVTGIMWKRFNSSFNALPGLQEVMLYDILIAPSSAESGEYTSFGSTVGTYQEFYLGTMAGCYNGAWIVGLHESTSECEAFNLSVAQAYADKHPFHYTPIYGVLLQRWQDMQLVGMDDGPWESFLGWPVLGPVAHGGGAQLLGPHGAYYAWSMWFEKGFMWWIDYDQGAYPDTPDEAQVYTWNGSNVFCYGEAGLTYSYLAPTVYYGGGGDLGVTVVVDSYRYQPTDAWEPVALSDDGTYYELGLKTNDGNPSGADPVNVAMHAHAYGGDGGSDCTYAYYTWAFRDGTIFMGDEAAAQYVTHTYGSTQRDMQAWYIVRVQVVDQSGGIAYGDSLPIHLGMGGGGGGVTDPEVVILRNDGGLAEASIAALREDLDELGCLWGEYDYDADPDIETKFGTYTQLRVVIWYHGGTGDPGEVGDGPFEDPWTDQEIDDYIWALNEGYGMLHVDPHHGHFDVLHFWPGESPYYMTDGWTGLYGFQWLMSSTDDPRLDKAASSNGDYYSAIPGYMDHAILFGPQSVVPYYGVGWCGPDDAVGATRAEIYDGSGSSGWRPSTCAYDAAYQFSGMGITIDMMAYTNGFFHGGANLDLLYGPWYNLHCSWGNTRAPDEGQCWDHPPGSTVMTWTTGPAMLWVMGYAYAPIDITASNKPSGDMTRAELLNNLLGWLDDGLTYGGGGAGAGGFSEYEGPPEVLQVMIGNWEEDADGGFHTPTPTVAYTYDGTNGALAVYPDQTSSDAYRTSGGYANAVHTTSPNNNYVNGNDVDFQFPWYAYIDDGGDGVETGAGNLGNDTVFFGGLLLQDTDASWTRLDPATYLPYALGTGPGYANVPSCVIDGWDPATTGPPVNVAGYYASTGGDTADEVRAHYGTQPAHLTFNNADELAAECVAHWDLNNNYSPLNPHGVYPVIYWTMYPGQNMLVPGTSDEIPDDASPWFWEAYRYLFDVDPSVTPTGRAGDIWNRPQFDFTDAASGGRVVHFNMRRVVNWNPDLNRDGSQDNADKYPVRVRLFTDFQDYAYWPGTWPDHLQDPGSDPVGVGWQNDGDYFEAGAYALDAGFPVYPLAITDDPDEDDPVDTVAGTPGNYTIDVGFIILFGAPNYTLSFELNSATHGQFFSNVPGTFGAPGAYMPTVPINSTAPDGDDYIATIHVTDAGMVDTASYTWPDYVTLAPPENFIEDFESYANQDQMLAAGWARGNTGAGYGGYKASWWFGGQYSYTYNSYYNKMVHMNLGETMGTYNPAQQPGNPPYFFYNQCYLRSPMIAVGSSMSPWFMWRKNIHLQYSSAGEYCRIGWSTNSSATHNYNSWNQMWSFTSQYYYQDSLYRYNTPAMAGNNVYLRFYYGCANTYYTYNEGAHLGSTCLMPGSTPPPGF